jgi:predicted outer membrane repeat protein
MYCDYASPNVTNCTFSGNSGLGGGGMLSFIESYPAIDSCTFSGNSGVYGAGIHCFRSSPTVSDCIFSDNSAVEGGGAMYCDLSYPSVSNCTFSGNSGDYGGGIACYEASPTISVCTFSQNWCTHGAGGGMFCWNSSSPAVTSCTFWRNSAGYNGATLYCATSSDLSIENTIIAFSSAGSAFLCDGGGTFNLGCCDIYGNAGGDWVGCIADQYGINGNFSADPMFCDTLNGDFSLQDCSPCLPGYHPDGYNCGGILGAYGSGCACQSATAPTTWGAIKSIYR